MGHGCIMQHRGRRQSARRLARANQARRGDSCLTTAPRSDAVDRLGDRAHQLGRLLSGKSRVIMNHAGRHHAAEGGRAATGFAAPGAVAARDRVPLASASGLEVAAYSGAAAPRAQRRVRRPGRLQAADHHDAPYEDSHKHQQHKTERAVSIVRVLDRGGLVKLAEELPQISRVRLPRRLRSSAVSVAVIRHFANST